MGLAAPLCLGQYVTVNATIVDAGGNIATKGTVVFTLQPQSSGILYYIQGTSTIATQKVTCAIQSDGTLKNVTSTAACQVAGNDIITPQNTLYQVQLYPNNTLTNTIGRVMINTSVNPYNLNLPQFGPQVAINPQYQTLSISPAQANVLPAADNIFTLGSSGYRWSTGYINNLFLAADPTVSLQAATKHYVDAISSVIPILPLPSSGQILVGNAGGTSYSPNTLSCASGTCTLSSLGILGVNSTALTDYSAFNGSLVHQSGNETIGGTKTFSGFPNLPAGTPTANQPTSQIYILKRQGSNVIDYGADPTYTSDSTSAFNNCLASSTTCFVPPGHYKITPTSTGAISLLNHSDLECINFQDGNVIIEGNGVGWILGINNTSSQLVKGCLFKNSYYGASFGSAGIVYQAGTVGPATFENNYFNYKDSGIYFAGLAVSYAFNNDYFSGDSGTNNFSKAIYGNCYNCGTTGGRIYANNIALDISGESWYFDHTDIEFNDIVFRTGTMYQMTVSKCHFETFGNLFTNAIVLPTIIRASSTPWTDNGGNGTGWNGRIIFEDNLINPGPNGTVNGIGAPLFVIKSQASMSGQLVLQGNGITYSGTNPSKFETVSSSFNYTNAASLVSGVQVFNYDVNITIPTIPADSFTSWADFSNGIVILGGRGNSITSTSLVANGQNVRGVQIQQSSNIGGTALAAGACASGTVTFSGVNRNWIISVSPVFYDPGGNFSIRASLNGDGPTATVYVCAITAGTPGAQQYNVMATNYQ